MRGTVLVLAAALVFPGSAMGIVTDAAIRWMSLDPGDLNLFVGTVNGALEYFSSELGASGVVPPLEGFHRALGAAVGEGVDLWLLRVGIEFTLAKAEVSTAGVFSLDGEDYDISFSVSLQNTRLGVRVVFPLLGGLLAVGASGGLSYTALDYLGAFQIPADRWAFAYVPPSGAISCDVGSFYGAAFVRASLPLILGFHLYLETGWHWQPTLPFLCDGGSVDLNGDGKDDVLQLFGLWLAGGIEISFGF
ncbi:hypothetical protein ACVNPS_02175 [Candidatus Bipolaricaulota sp. J31]